MPGERDPPGGSPPRSPDPDHDAGLGVAPTWSHPPRARAGSPRALSGASLGLDGAELPPPPDVGEVRYEDGGLLGRGGMGEVRLVHDRLLGRDVALKRAVRHRGQEVRREATLTASLEHPNIVPVYGAGHDPDGNAFYTMRAVRGRSLADAIRDASGRRERLRLVRAFRGAVDAAAYAHAHGVVHRDIKPENILLGEFGDTVLADWGLAARVGEGMAGRVGTPQYAAPEQLDGCGPAVSADVFSLGATLFALLTGRPPRDGADPHAPIPPVLAVDPDAPAELAAVADRALSAEPSDRYPDAVALADVVDAWFEGRRVAAYTYSTSELVGRLWVRWRLRVALGAVLLVAVGLATAIGWWRTAHERDRALAAEQAALASRSLAEHNLARALVSRARVAEASDERALAELLAAEAILLVDDADARGVLAGQAVAPRPELLRTLAWGGCAQPRSSWDGDVAACMDERGLRVVDVVGDPPQVVPWPIAPVPGVEVWIARGVAVVQDLSQGMTAYTRDGRVVEMGRVASRELDVVDVDLDGAALQMVGRGALGWGERPMWPAALVPVVDAALHGQDKIAVVNDDHLAVLLDGYDERVLASIDSAADGVPLFVRWSRHARQVVTVTTSGRVIVADAADGRPARVFDLDVPEPADLALSGDLLAISSGQREVEVWDLARERRVARLPYRVVDLRWIEDRTLRVIGEEIRDWRMPDDYGTQVSRSGEGVAALAVDPASELIASAHGDGYLNLWDVKTGARTLEFLVHPGVVVKDVVFAPDGRSLFVAAAGAREVVRLAVGTGEVLERRQIAAGVRRLAIVDGVLYAATYANTVVLWAVDELPMLAEYPLMVRPLDIAPAPDGRGVYALDDVGYLYRVDPETGATRIGDESDGFAISRVNGELLVAGRRHVKWGGKEATLEGAVIVGVVVSPDNRWIATGHRDGTVTVLDAATLVPVARMRGHRERVASLAFTDDGRWLVTGSWDGELRRWAMAPLTASPLGLKAEVEAAWGATADELLRGMEGATWSREDEEEEG